MLSFSAATSISYFEKCNNLYMRWIKFFYIAQSAFCASISAVFRGEERVHCAKRKAIVHKLFDLNNPGGYKEMSSVFTLCWLIAPSYTSPNAGGLGVRGISANEYSCAHHVTWSPNKLWRSTSIFHLWNNPNWKLCLAAESGEEVWEKNEESVGE